MIVVPPRSPSGKAIRNMHFAPPLHDVEAPLPAFADMSRSSDLGYTYGSYQLVKKASGEKVESGNYYRIWKKQDGITGGRRWTVVTDLLDPVKEKN